MIMTEAWEVDIRSRKTGDSIETIFSGEWHDEAMDCLNRWYDERPELKAELEALDCIEDFVDGTDGIFADIYATSEPHGVGKWEEAI